MGKTHNGDFLLPHPSEKLAAKFIRDSIKKKSEIRNAKATTKKPAPAEKSKPMPKTPEQLQVPLEAVRITPDKKYFRIGEAAELLGVEPYVLRYWESEFSGIRPMKTKSGHRTYSKKDMERFSEIRHLLYVEKFSVKGAKKQLGKKKAKPAEPNEAQRNSQHKERVKGLIQDLKGLIQVARGNPGL